MALTLPRSCRQAEPVAAVQRLEKDFGRQPKFFEHARAEGGLQFKSAETDGGASTVRAPAERERNGVQEIAGAKSGLDLKSRTVWSLL